jgi:hypothetical protein
MKELTFRPLALAPCRHKSCTCLFGFFGSINWLATADSKSLELANRGGADHAVPLGCCHYGVDHSLRPCVWSSACAPFRNATTNCRRLRQAAEEPPPSPADVQLPLTSYSYSYSYSHSYSYCHSYSLARIEAAISGAMRERLRKRGERVGVGVRVGMAVHRSSIRTLPVLALSIGP